MSLWLIIFHIRWRHRTASQNSRDPGGSRGALCFPTNLPKHIGHTSFSKRFCSRNQRDSLFLHDQTLRSGRTSRQRHRRPVSPWILRANTYYSVRTRGNLPRSDRCPSRHLLYGGGFSQYPTTSPSCNLVPQWLTLWLLTAFTRAKTHRRCIDPCHQLCYLCQPERSTLRCVCQ